MFSHDINDINDEKMNFSVGCIQATLIVAPEPKMPLLATINFFGMPQLSAPETPLFATIYFFGKPQLSTYVIFAVNWLF